MKKADIIVLSGQSNAVGCGEVRCLYEHYPADVIQKWRKGYDNVKINYFSHDKKSGGFVPTSLNCTVVSDDTLGPEVGIAAALDEKYPGREFFIVKLAFGGVSLCRDFLPPSGGDKYDPLSYADHIADINAVTEPGANVRAGWCYNELVKLLSESIASLEKDGYSPVIRAFCWMQGESDSLYEEATAGYAKNYDALLRDFKAAFAGYADGCRFIDAGISAVWERYEKINEIKRGYAEKRGDCAYIDTIGAGLTTMNEPPEAPDIGHYDSGCYITLGRLFADAIGDL